MSDYKSYRVKRDIGKAAPGYSLGHRLEFDFKAGDIIWLVEMAGQSGVSYWTNCDIDGAFIFTADEVELAGPK